MSTPSGARRSSARHRSGAGRPAAPPRNPLLIAAVLCAVVLAGVCLVIWVMPAGDPVSAAHRAAAQTAKNDLEIQIATTRASIAAQDTVLAAKQQDLANLETQLNPDTSANAAEIKELTDRIDRLELNLAPQRAEIAQLRKARADAEGNLKLEAEVLKAVNSCLIKTIDRDGDFVCGTVIRGWMFSASPRFSPWQVVYGAGRAAEGIQVINTLRQNSPYLAVRRYDHADPRDPAFDRQGFTPDWYETTPKDGQAVYCVCHQMVGETALNNTVVTGVCAGTKTLGGQVFIKTTLPARDEMAGAPVVTAEGKLVGILMPKLPGVEDLCLIFPVADLNRIATGQ